MKLTWQRGIQDTRAIFISADGRPIGYLRGDHLSPDDQERLARILCAGEELLNVCELLLDIVRIQNGNLHDDLNHIQQRACDVIQGVKGK